MSFFLKIISAFLKLVLNQSVYNKLMFRLKETKKIMTRTKELDFFFTVLFFPIKFVLDLFVSIIKFLLLWTVPSQLYGDLHYTEQLFIKDIIESNMPLKKALKRTILCLELFTKGAEKKKSFGNKNPDKTFFVIRPYYFNKPNELYPSDSHLMFHYYRNLQHLSHAINHGWIPVVDWKNYGPLPHAEDYPINGTTNSWEYFWKQPSEYTLEEVYQSKNVILSSQNSVSYGYIPSMLIQPPFSTYAKQLVIKCPRYSKLFPFNDVTEERIEGKMKEIFPQGKKILGVSVRATSYGIKSISRHPKQPTLGGIIDTVKKKLVDWEIDYIFFTCESEEVVNIMREEFGERLLYLERLRYKELPQVENNPLYAPGQKYQTNLDYLTEMALLSRCNSLIAGMSGGVRAAIIWNEGRYENIEIFDTGLWK